MAYSHTRLRKTLAIVRILTGLVFVSMGLFKVSSLEFARVNFPDFLEAAIRGGAVEWIRPLLDWVLNYGPARICVAIGFTELFIGIAMVLGLAVRPAAVVGMLYATTLFLTTWHGVAGAPAMMQGSDHQYRFLFPVLVFLLLAIGHAGETWGLGALYHHHRSRRWERTPQAVTATTNPVEAVTEVDEEPGEEGEAGSFEEFLEQEQRARNGRQEQDLHDKQLHDFSRI